MKKIITLMFCTALLTSAFAQTNNRDWDNRNTKGNSNWNSNNAQKDQRDDHGYDRDDQYRRDDGHRNYADQNNAYRLAERERQIQRINDQYDYRIQQVTYDRSITRHQRKRAIRYLQEQKENEISNVYSKYNNSNAYNYGKDHDHHSDNRFDHHDR